MESVTGPSKESFASLMVSLNTTAAERDSEKLEDGVNASHTQVSDVAQQALSSAGAGGITPVAPSLDIALALQSAAVQPKQLAVECELPSEAEIVKAAARASELLAGETEEKEMWTGGIVRKMWRNEHRVCDSVVARLQEELGSPELAMLAFDRAARQPTSPKPLSYHVARVLFQCMERLPQPERYTDFAQQLVAQHQPHEIAAALEASNLPYALELAVTAAQMLQALDEASDPLIGPANLRTAFARFEAHAALRKIDPEGGTTLPRHLTCHNSKTLLKSACEPIKRGMVSDSMPTQKEAQALRCAGHGMRFVETYQTLPNRIMLPPAFAYWCMAQVKLDVPDVVRFLSRLCDTAGWRAEAQDFSALPPGHPHRREFALELCGSHDPDIKAWGLLQAAASGESTLIEAATRAATQDPTPMPPHLQAAFDFCVEQVGVRRRVGLIAELGDHATELRARVEAKASTQTAPELLVRSVSGMQGGQSAKSYDYLQGGNRCVTFRPAFYAWTGDDFYFGQYSNPNGGVVFWHGHPDAPSRCGEGVATEDRLEPEDMAAYALPAGLYDAIASAAESQDVSSLVEAMTNRYAIFDLLARGLKIPVDLHVESTAQAILERFKGGALQLKGDVKMAVRGGGVPVFRVPEETFTGHGDNGFTNAIREFLAGGAAKGE
jgi:hypothetical protein